MSHRTADMTCGMEIRSVVYESPGVAASTFQQTHLQRLALADVPGRLRKSIEAVDMWILHEIDPQNDAAGALARYQNVALTALGEELYRACQAIAEDFHD
jgi:hypothetical protein